MIFPRPQSEEYFEGKYILKSKYNTMDLYDFWLSVKNGTKDISFLNNTDLCYEEYEINIGLEGIRIVSSCDAGAFRAITTLRQMIGEGEAVNFCKIKDFPHFKRRSYMLEVSCRNPLITTLKGMVDKLAELKYNEFQLYMEGFCYKFEAYPEVTDGIDCLGPKEMEELDRYCSDRFIELIPTLNGFGHMCSWLKHPKFAHLAVGSAELGTLDIGNPESFELVANTYKSLLPHFKSNYVNIGLDEVSAMGKYQLEEICKQKGEGVVFMEWMNKLADLCRDTYGKRVMFWDDMMVNYTDCLDMIPEDATVLSWSYDMVQTQMWAERVMNYAQKGLRFYMCCCNDTWDTFTGRSEISHFNLRAAGDIGLKYGAEGYMLTDWGCSGHPEFLVISYIPCALGAQYSWNVGIEQTGGHNKNEFVYNARKYANKYMFKADIADHVARLADYYMLEPERPFGVTCSFYSLCCPMSEHVFSVWFDMDYFFDSIPFYFTNVISYINRILSELKNSKCDLFEKREIILDAELAILGARLMLHRYNPDDKKEIEESIRQIDCLSQEYNELWCNRNYKNGVNVFLNNLYKRKKELQEIVSAKQ